MAPNPALCTAAQIAAMYGTSADTVRRWARDGRIPVVFLPSGRMRFDPVEVSAHIAAGQVSA